MTRTVAMWLIVPVMLIMSSWPAVTMAQEKCSVDADCMSTQFCDKLSLTCTDYTLCSSYNRKESSKPSRAPSTCGGCLEGYSPDRPIKSTPEAYRCKGDHQQLWEVLSVFGPLVILVFIVFHCMVSPSCVSSCCCTDRAATLCNLDLEMVEAGISTAIAPPTPSSIPEMNKREYDDVEPNPVPTIDRQVPFPIDIGCPGRTRVFHPPYNITIDIYYDPDNQPIYPPTDIVNEE